MESNITEEEGPRKRFPKVQLHVHLDGAVRHSTLWEVAKARGISVPGKTFADFVNTFRSSDRLDMTTFLSNFRTILPIIRGDKDIIKRVAYELCEDQARQGVVYFEARYCPHLLTASQLPSAPDIAKENRVTSPWDVVHAVNTGMRRGCRDFGVIGRTILCMIRTNPEFSSDVVELAEEFQNDTVVGVDLAGDEEVSCTKEHEDAYRIARELGIHRTVHAGELGPAANVRYAIEALGAERIGHGYHITEERDVYQMVHDRSIHLELCPTSSLRTGAWKGPINDHVTKRFFKDGFNISLNTDDPTILFNTMVTEFQLAKDHFEMSDFNLAELTMNAAKSSFLPERERMRLMRDLQAEFEMS